MILLKLRVERSPAAMHPISLRREISPLCFAAVEMTVGQVALVSSASFRNDYKLPAAVSSRAEVHVVIAVNVFSAIETQSREISGHNVSCTIWE